MAAAAITGWLVSAGPGFTPVAVSALAVVYVLLVGGTAFTAGIYPRPTAWSLFAIPCAPLAMWSCVRGPLSRLTGRVAGVLAPLAVVGLTLLILSVWILRPDSP